MSLIKALRRLDQLHHSRMIGAMRERRLAEQALVDHDVLIEEKNKHNEWIAVHRRESWETRPAEVSRSTLFRLMEKDAEWRHQQLDGEQALRVLVDEREDKVERVRRAASGIQQAIQKQRNMAHLIQRERRKHARRVDVADDNEIEEQVYANR